nr:reverse transcriptase domain-containing protein [Tanacetum cinerariifolium]
MNNGAGGSGGASGFGGAGGSGGTGRNADGTGVRGAGPTVPELTGCTYATFIKCNPLPFNGTEGAVDITTTRIVMANPNPKDPNVPNEYVPKEDPFHLLEYDEEEYPEMDIEEEEPEEDPVGEPEPLAGHGDQFDAHPNPQPGNINDWVDHNNNVKEPYRLEMSLLILSLKPRRLTMSLKLRRPVLSLRLRRLVLSMRLRRLVMSLRPKEAESETKMVRKGAVPKPPFDDEGSKRPRKTSKKSDGDEGPSDSRGPLMIMPPKPMSEARMREIIRNQFATSMNEFMANMNNGAGGSGGASGFGGAGGSSGAGGNADGTGVRGVRLTVPELTGCTYATFIKCNPLPFNGTEGTVERRKLWVSKLLTIPLGVRMVELEAVKVEQYLWGLTKSIHGDVTSSQPATINDAVRLAYQLVGQLIQDKADEATDGKKRKGEGDRGSLGDNRHEHNRRQNQRRGNAGAMTNAAPKNNEICQKCKNQRHAGDCWRKKDCPKLGRNGQGGNNHGGAYRLGAMNAQEDPKVVTGMFLLKNHYATALFDSGADRSFVSTKFSTLINIKPVKIDTSYEVEFVDGKIVSTNNVLKGCTLNLLNHSFPIDLMVIELGSFDVIIGMDWLSKNDAAILCGEKKVRIPLKNKALIIEGDRNQSRLKVISYIKALKYIENGCELFLAQVTRTVYKEKRVEDVPVIRDFPEVFPKDLPGLPPPRQVEFRIDLIPGATPVARTPYRLASSKLKE